MDREAADLFEEFDEVGRAPDASSLRGRLIIRQARLQDADALGRLSAAREGGDAPAHSAVFMRAIKGEGMAHRPLILVAEMESDILGFGKARHLGEEHVAGAGASPEGWYLTGLVVDPRFRRRGVGLRLTAERLQWIAERSQFAYYLSNARNLVSIALHQRFGFIEVARGAELAGVSFVGGEGILFQVDLARLADPVRACE